MQAIIAKQSDKQLLHRGSMYFRVMFLFSALCILEDFP